MNDPLIFFAAVLVLGTAAQWVAWRLHLPSILLLLATGFLVGYLFGDNPNVEGLTVTDEVVEPRLLFPIVSLAVAVIMFEGGLTLRVRELDNSASIVVRMVTIGVFVTWVLSTLALFFLVGMGPFASALTGAILVVTGPTVIAPMLRHVRPARRVGSIIKWEGIVIDPIGAILAVLVFDAVIAGHAKMSVVMLLKIASVGVLLGVATALSLVQLMKRYSIPDFLHNPVFLASAVGAFAVSNQIAPETGLLTVTVMGVTLANQRVVPVRHVLEFKENLRVLLISCLFVVLAARIQVQDVFALGWGGFWFLIVSIVVIRPLSVFLATWGTELNLNEKLFMACMAPRGIVAAAVSSIFAIEMTRHLSANEPVMGAEKIVPVTFLVIVGTVSFYGPAAGPLARRLGLAVKNPQGLLFAGASPWARTVAKAVLEEGIPVLMVDTNHRNISDARMLGLPARCVSIVAEYMEEIELAGIGRLIAVTPNDDLNTLAAIEFASVFGRANVYQLPANDESTSKRDTVSSHLVGRFLFGKSADYTNLAMRHAQGAQIKKTKITEEHSFDDFLSRYGASTLVLFVVDDTGSLRISTLKEPLVPEAGETVIAMVGQASPDNHMSSDRLPGDKAQS